MTCMLKCIESVCERQKKLSALPPTEHLRLRDELHEILEDVKIYLCKMLSLLVTAPVTGRMFIPLPDEYLSEETITQSVYAQLGLHKDLP